MAEKTGHFSTLGIAWLLVAHVGLLALGTSTAIGATTEHARIHISGNANFTAANGVSGGTGTPGDPYIIEDLVINASAGDGIYIEKSDAHVMLRNLSIYGGFGPSDFASAVMVRGASNFSIENLTARGTRQGVAIYNDLAIVGDSITIIRSTFSNTGQAIYAQASNLTIEGNFITASGEAISLERPTDGVILNNTIDRDQGTAGSGIYLASATNVTGRGNQVRHMETAVEFAFGQTAVLFEGNTIEENSLGIYADAYGATDLHIVNNTVVGNSAGIRFYAADFAEVRGNNISENTFYPFFVSQAYTKRLDIVSNQFVGNGQGVDVSTDARIEGNRFEQDGGPGLSVVSNAAIDVVDNTFVGGGLALTHGGVPGRYGDLPVALNMPQGNTVNAKPLVYWNATSGALLDGAPVGQLIAINCTNVSLRNLTIQGVYRGVDISYTDGVDLSGLRLSDIEDKAVRVTDAANVTIASSVVERADFGVFIEATVNSKVTNNLIRETRSSAFWVHSSRVSTADSNVIVYGAQQGASANDIDGINWTRNLMGGFPADIGVYNVRGQSRVTGNNFYLPDTRNVGDGYNFVNWDDGYPAGGNFWQSYPGPDLCSGPAQDICTGQDGIGDVAYQFTPLSVDHYPLVAPVPMAAQAPLAALVASPSPLFETQPTTISAEPSRDVEDDAASLQVRWDWEGDGTFDTSWSTVKNVTHAFASAGVFSVVLEVRDSDLLVDQQRLTLSILPLSADSEGPTIIVISPNPANAVFADQLFAEGRAADANGSGVTRVELRFDGGAWVVANGTEVWNSTFDIQGGPHTFEARAFDRAGNPSQTVTLPFTAEIIDIHPPTIEVSYPPDGLVVGDANLTATGTASDRASGIFQVRVTVGNASWTTAVGAENWTFSAVLAEGVNSLVFWAVDRAGYPSVEVHRNVTYQPAALADVTPPTMAAPAAPASAEAGSSITLNLTVTDANSLGHVVLLYRSDSSANFSSMEMAASGGSAFSATVQLPSSAGTLEYYFEATDAAGNTARTPSSGSFSVPITAPATLPSPRPALDGSPSIMYAVIAMAAVALARRMMRR